MSQANLYKLPGYIFTSGKYEGATTAPDLFRIQINSGDYNGPVFLEKRFLPDEMTLVRGKVIKNLVVIGHDDTGIKVAKKGYFDHLFRHFYNSKGNLFQLADKRHSHWEKEWQRACAVNQFDNSYKITGRGYKGNVRWFELQSLKCAVPLCGAFEVEHLKGQNFFFPDSLYNLSNLPRSLYKTDNVDMPVYCRGIVKIGDRGVKPVNIYLHGPTSPAKWHCSVLKHVLCVPPYGKPSDRELWQAFEGRSMEKFDDDITSECRQNERKSSCDEYHCRKGKLFTKVHPAIREACKRYLLKAAAFFLEKNYKLIKIKSDNPHSREAPPHKIEVNCRWKRENSPFADALAKANISMKTAEYESTLILRGFSFDWNSSYEPTLHLQLITLYSGSISGQKVRFKRDHLIETGRLEIVGQ